jgi:acyl-CoA thioesterase
VTEGDPGGGTVQAVGRADGPGAALHRRDPSARWLGIELVEAGAGHAVVTMSVTPQMCNGHGTCHGGLIFTLADAAFAFACNSAGAPTVAAAASIEFLRAVPAGAMLRATATERWQAGRTGIYDGVVELDDGEPVALFRGRSHRVGGVPGAASEVRS